ncbi:MAG TPA: hypothetical protein VHS97_04255, partial [Isosphaeraceae bacterium]|nr:hypothetical protein [Isosphaeraceae bacterium]
KATARVVARLVFITKGRLSPTFVFRTGPRREIAHCRSLRVPGLSATQCSIVSGFDSSCNIDQADPGDTPADFRQRNGNGTRIYEYHIMLRAYRGGG